jgi:hypothetical protein
MYTPPANSESLNRELAIFKAIKLRDDYRATGIKPPSWKVDKVYGMLLAALSTEGVDTFWTKWYDINRELLTMEKE